MKENELQKDCFMYELKQLMKKYGLKSVKTKDGSITVDGDSIKATGITFEMQQNVFDEKRNLEFTICALEEIYKV
jgi:hypothetical protein